MALMTKLKHVDRLKDGSLRYRRRIPLAAQEAVGRKVFQQRLQSKEGSALIKEYAEIDILYEQVVSQRLSQARKEALWADTLGKPLGRLRSPQRLSGRVSWD